jgi:RHS repeat-associated protein
MRASMVAWFGIAARTLLCALLLCPLTVDRAIAQETVQYSYDSSGRLATVTNTDSTTRTFVYENASFPNALTGEIDENGNRFSTWGYDTQGRANSSTEALGANATGLTYNSNGSVTVTDALTAARIFTFGRYGDRNLVAGISGSQCATCTEGAATTYDAAAWVASRTDYDGNLTCYANDPVRGLELVRVEGFAPGSTCPANLASYTPAMGTLQRKISTVWSSTFRLPTQITEPARTTVFQYDGYGNVLTKTVTDTTVIPNVSRVWKYTYYNSGLYGQLHTLTGPRTDISTDVTTYTYFNCTTGAQCGQINTITSASTANAPAGLVTTYNTYNGYGQPLTVTDPNGVLTTLTYDLRARLTSSQAGTGATAETTSFSYYPTGPLQLITRPDGSTIQFNDDTAHRVQSAQDGLGNSIQYTLDALGNRTAENRYDPSMVLSLTISRVYNTLSQLYQTIGAAGTSAVTTTLGYDAQGNQTSINAPLNRNTTNNFDALNRLYRVTDPINGVTQFAFDANDNLISVTDPKSLVTTYGYNGFGEPTQLTSPDTGSSSTSYDSAGNVASTVDARGFGGMYSYDALNRVTQIAYGDQTLVFSYDAGTNGKGHLTGASDASHSMSWQYDPQGRVTGKSQTVAGITKPVSYAYTNADLTTLTTPSGQTVTYSYNNGQISSISINGTTLLSGVVYDPFGPTRGWTWGNSSHETRLRDHDGNPSQISGIESTSYSVDNAFRITGISNASNPSLSWSFGYDLLDRLTGATQTSSSLSWTYDANGNRLTQGGTPNLSYAASSISTNYNHRGRVISATAGGVTTSYVLNALGERIEKSSSVGSLLFVYDEAGHLLGEYSGTGALIEETVWLGDLPVATMRPNGSGINVYYIHADHLGTPKMVTRPSDNAILWRWDQDPFGSAQPNQNPQSLGVFVYNSRFQGQYYDAETGTNYNYQRDAYDSRSGRYWQGDPLGLAGGSYSTYSYAENSPIGNVDPLGLCDEDKCKQLLEEMDKLVNSVRPGDNPSAYKGLAQRFRQLLRLPPGEFPGHAKQIENRQAELQNKIQEYIDSGCGNPPGFATAFANMPIPQAPNQNNLAIDPQTQKQLAQSTAEAGVLAIILRILAGAALAF